MAFSSKLKGLLDYYLESRRVTTFEKLSELLVCDRIKSVLSEGCLRYVLSIESASTNIWLPMRELTEAIDKYLAALTGTNDNPKAFAVGQAPAPRASGFSIPCLLYTSDAADDLLCVDLGGRRIIFAQLKFCLLYTSPSPRD